MDTNSIIKTLLINRGIKTTEEEYLFFHPIHPDVISSPFDTDTAIQLIKEHISKNNKITIVGDYDVDGICSTAILWEGLHSIYGDVTPYIPHRRDDGYGLSNSVIEKVLSTGTKLIITVDCGITSVEQVKLARDSGCDVIIIDHHSAGEILPNANITLHSTSTCAAGLAWMFCRDFKLNKPDHLALVALAVICDIIPLVGQNRSFAKFGLGQLNTIKRPGLLALFKIAGIDTTLKPITPYEVGFLIGPRLNAMGRLEHALDSLRLICTNDVQKGFELANLLNETNTARQELTQQAVEHAINSIDADNLPNLIIVSDESYDEGVIGLVAAKLVEKFHRPSIAINKGVKNSKGSARSIPGFNLVEYLRLYPDLFISMGGHAMAAGLTVSTERLDEVKKTLSAPEISTDLLIKKYRYDLEVEISDLSTNLYLQLQDFAPFGLGNPQPVFKSYGQEMVNTKKIGKQSQHLKFSISNLDAIYFNSPESINSLEPRTKVDLIYSLDLNIWNGRSNLQLICKNIEISEK